MGYMEWALEQCGIDEPQCHSCQRKMKDDNEFLLFHGTEKIIMLCRGCYIEAKQRKDEKTVKIEMGGMKRIRTLKTIEWQNYGMPLQTLPAGWEGNITRYRPGSATALLKDGGMFAICDCFLTDGSVEELNSQEKEISNG